jgi:hypothetical protein
MVRIRPRQPGASAPPTVAGRPLSGVPVPPSDEALDELAGVEAFSPHPDHDPEDPFALRTTRRGDESGAARARVGLVAAGVVLVAGLLSLVLGLADDDDDDVRSDDVAAEASTTTTGSTVRATTTSSAAGTTSTSSGFAPGTTSTTVAHPTVTTVRPSTTLTATTAVPDRPLVVEVEVRPADGGSDIVAGEPVDITVRLSDPDAIPTGNCLRVVVTGGPDDDTLANNPCDTSCPSGAAAAAPEGGTFENFFTYAFPEDGNFHVVVTGRSGHPGCGNDYAELVSPPFETPPIVVAPAD